LKSNFESFILFIVKAGGYGSYGIVILSRFVSFYSTVACKKDYESFGSWVLHITLSFL